MIMLDSHFSQPS